MSKRAAEVDAHGHRENAVKREREETRERKWGGAQLLQIQLALAILEEGYNGLQGAAKARLVCVHYRCGSPPDK